MMKKSYEQELSDVFKKLYEKRKNAIDVYDALAYWSLFRDVPIPCVPHKNHNKFMAGLKASAKKCGLRIYREKICYNNCLISTYLPYIDSVDEIIFPDGKTCCVISFVLLIPKFVDQGPIVKTKANGSKKELCLTYNNKLAWEDIEADYKEQFDCCYISAIPGIKHTFLFGESLKLNISELKKLFESEQSYKTISRKNES